MPVPGLVSIHGPGSAAAACAPSGFACSGEVCSGYSLATLPITLITRFSVPTNHAAAPAMRFFAEALGWWPRAWRIYLGWPRCFARDARQLLAPAESLLGFSPSLG